MAPPAGLIEAGSRPPSAVSRVALAESSGEGRRLRVQRQLNTALALHLAGGRRDTTAEESLGWLAEADPWRLLVARGAAAADIALQWARQVCEQRVAACGTRRKMSTSGDE